MLMYIFKLYITRGRQMVFRFKTEKTENRNLHKMKTETEKLCKMEIQTETHLVRFDFWFPV